MPVVEQKIQPQPYPLPGQALPTGWGQYPQGAYYPPPVQKPQELNLGRTEVVQSSLPVTTSTTTQYIEVQNVPSSTLTTGGVLPGATTMAGVLPGTTVLPATTATTVLGGTTCPVSSMIVGGLASGVIGPNTYGVPENFPMIPSDTTCTKCHGTGYKKTMLTRRWKACSRCASKYGTDTARLNLHDLPPHHHHHGYTTAPVAATTLGTTEVVGGGATILGTTTTGSYVAAPAYTTTTATALPMTALPTGFQTLPANPQCVKCSGLGYRRSKRAHNQWKGCRVCATQYGTDLSRVVIPASTSIVAPQPFTTF